MFEKSKNIRKSQISEPKLFQAKSQNRNYFLYSIILYKSKRINEYDITVTTI